MQATRPREATIPSLSSAEVRKRIQSGDSNDYEARVGRSYWDIFRDNVLNLFNLVLGSLLVIVIGLGDYATAFFAGFSVVTNTFFGMLQEFNAKRKLDQLAALAEQSVRCRRDGQWQDVPMREVVKDEIIFIQPGDRLVVDGIVLQADSLEVDESQLTGESDAIAKSPDDRVLSGSFCTAGTGIMRATEVGERSQINRLSAIARQYKLPKTPTQIKIDITVEVAVLLMLVFVPLIFITGQLLDSAFLEVVRNAVVFTTSLVPQGLVLVAILSLTIGAVKISMQQTLIQRVNAVESLANATVLCFDKTGTLTQNKLAVREILPIGAADESQIRRDLQIALANMAHHNNTAQALARHLGETDPANLPQKLSEIPFSSARKWSAVCLPGQTLLLGAPERLLPADHPHAYTAEQLARDGMRVLAFAQTSDPPDIDAGVAAWNLEPLALIVMSDQIREDIQDTLAAFRAEGLTLKVISGDNLETRARNRPGERHGHRQTRLQRSRAGRHGRGASSTAPWADSQVFARIEPHTKQRIVSALRENGEYVAMVGDGVNDVPALKAADLAIVMNDGAQISKDVADIVLLNNAMSTLPRAFGEGKATTQTIFGTIEAFSGAQFLHGGALRLRGFHGAALPDYARANKLGDLRHGQPAGHADRFRLAATAVHVPLPPRCAGLHREHGLHRRGDDDGAIPDHLAGGRGRFVAGARRHHHHGRALWHAHHLACAGRGLVRPAEFRQALAAGCIERGADGWHDPGDVRLPAALRVQSAALGWRGGGR